MMQAGLVLCSEFSYDFIDNIFISPIEHQMPRVKITLLVFKSEIKITLTSNNIYFFYAKMWRKKQNSSPSAVTTDFFLLLFLVISRQFYDVQRIYWEYYWVKT